MLGKLDEIPGQICDKADVEIDVRFLSRCGLSSSSSPPLARAVSLISDNDGAFEIFVNHSLAVPDINLASIHPELDVFRPGPNLYNSHALHTYFPGYSATSGNLPSKETSNK